MKKVYICSPHEGERELYTERAVIYSRAAALGGYAPITTHFYQPQFLYDSDKDEQRIGLAIGREFMKQSDEVWVFGVHNISSEMEAEIELADQTNIPVVDGFQRIADVIPNMDPFEQDILTESMWEEFMDVPMDTETGCIDESFAIWPAGTHHRTVWRWFDKYHSEGSDYLLNKYQKQMGKCFVLKNYDYAKGIDIRVFSRKEDAENRVRAEVRSIMAELKEDGHKQVRTIDIPNGISVCTSDDNIYCWWVIEETGIL